MTVEKSMVEVIGNSSLLLLDRGRIYSVNPFSLGLLCVVFCIKGCTCTPAYFSIG
jgi:hypothetical protein